jgi:hypothetical protein
VTPSRYGHDVSFSIRLDRRQSLGRRESPTATVRRIVARAGRRCDLTVPRNDLGEVAAMLIDGMRVPAGARFGRRAHSARGVEVNIACAVMGRDLTGRRPRASIELLGASIAQPWLSLHDAVRSPKGIGIVVTDGDNGIEHLPRA